ncbi:hypothetical protein RJ640_027204 [Escallonia rubra]|uniref:Uncharacterized protein n=1 Tax=Escallonia rubra TaxID=112253 RepID=A0AA88UL12_9ASTE|nr:hypothetical protein RJ640_027204 [Escallonia rubra]
MDFVYILTFICLFNLHPSIAQNSTVSWAGDAEESLSTITADEETKFRTYIVHVSVPDGQTFTESETLDSWYNSFLPTTTSGLNDQSRMVHTYRNVVSGFAARLSPEEVKAMEKKDGFVSATPQRMLSLHTTHTPNFLGLHQNLGFWKGSNYGKGIIIGLMDSGITPNHPSFSDEGVPPPPRKWKGKCQLKGKACNNKLIGARSFVSGESVVDADGHGTHTASTAGGNNVKDANVFGQANGTASGMAPLAHVAMYKVCSDDGCFDSDILAGMDAAIEDGVDVLSLSLGGPSLPFFDDSIAIGAFGAVQKGMFVSCSAGNSGPVNTTLSNEAPWILTVGASTVDRRIRATALLGNKEELDGESIFQPKDFPTTLLPLVFPGQNGDQNAAWCADGSLKNADVKGKVVLCQRGGGIARLAKGQTVKDAGGAAMILMNQEPDGDSTLADPHVLPATHVGYVAGSKILSYITSTSSPTATILFKGTVIGVPYAPEVTSFSSRGPSFSSPGILKPDIIGPGVSILAAWPFSVENRTDTRATFNVVSGTSMSCPHLSGIAALLKSAHPTWSPAAIKSAIMTTAGLLNLDGKPIVDERFLQADLFAIGAGHVNPSSANDPGLVYDIQPDDYIPYLCGLGYTSKQVEVIVHHKVSCSKKSSIPEAELNYPSFAITLGTNDQTYTRTVTNVGEANSSYTVEIFPPPGVSVSVMPYRLDFSEVNQQLTYSVTFTPSNEDVITPEFVQGYVKWSSDKHFVRSPISVELV